MANFLTSVWNSNANKNIGALQTKKNEIEESRNVITNKKNDWGKWAGSMASNVLSTIIFVLIGCNFIFYTSLYDKSKQTLFPTNTQQYYVSNSKDINMGDVLNPLLKKQQGGMNDCKSKDKISIENLGNSVRKMGVPPNTGWPYSMIEDSNMDLSIQGFKNWYGISVAEIMINLRKLLLIIVGFFDKDDKTIFTTDMFQIIFSNVIFTLIPLLLPISLPVIFIIFLAMSSFTAWKNDEHPFHLFFLAIFFCGPAAFLSGGVMVTSFIQFLFTFLLLPLFLNQSKLKKIALCNADLFTYLFGALCVSSTMTHLDDKYGYCALVLYIIALLRRLYKLYK
jgi:hypothetical protein